MQLLKMSKNKLIIYVAIISISVIIRIIYPFASCYGGTDIYYQFNASHNIAHGLVPYRDFNMVTTPLYYFIGALGLKISDTLQCKLIIDSILNILYLIVLYNVYKKLSEKDNLETSTITDIAFILMELAIIPVGGEYNSLTVMFGLLAYLVYENQNIKYGEQIQGILAACAILTKQTTGTFIAVVILWYVIKKNRKKIPSFLIAGLSVGLIFLAYLLVTNAFDEFLDYCLFGVSNFSNRSLIPKLADISLIAIAFIVICIQRKKNIELKILVLASLSQLYPLADHRHSIVLISMLLVIVAEHIVKTDSVKFKVCTCLIILLASMYNIRYYHIDFNKNKNLHNTYSTDGYDLFSNEKEMIEQKFGKQVLYIRNDTGILDYYLGTNSGVYSMFLIGNLGTKSPEELVDMALDKGYIVGTHWSSEDIHLIVWQFPYDIIDYLKNNHTLIYESTDSSTIYFVK